MTSYYTWKKGSEEETSSAPHSWYLVQKKFTEETFFKIFSYFSCHLTTWKVTQKYQKTLSREDCFLVSIF